MGEYGNCPMCGSEFYAPKYTKVKEVDDRGIPTGRVIAICDYLLCDDCGHTDCVDDSFDKIISNKCSI